MAFLLPPQWTDADLRAGRNRAERSFVDYRREDGPRSFERVYERLLPSVEAFFDASDDLLHLDAAVFEQDPDAWQVARYVTGPPISQEDLWTLVEGPKFRRVPTVYAAATAAAISVVIDPIRFPWVGEHRVPTDHERDRAVMGTCLLWAAQQIGTERRGQASTRQERMAGEALASADLSFDSSRGRVHFLDDMTRGTYSKERHIAGAKCDVPARLFDGRLFAVECKVSNGPKNGWKRVNREVAGKANSWRGEFGSSVITAVVLAGVFDLSALVSARDNGVSIFWEHDLCPLVEFVTAARP